MVNATDEVEVRMPRLSESMVEGTILSWLSRHGAAVRRGEPLAEIETDKASVAFEADADGVLEILVPAGETRPVGAPIARLYTANPSSAPSPGEPPAGPSSTLAASAIPAAISPAGSPSTAPPRTPPSPGAPAPEPPASSARVFSSPLARRLATRLGVELSTVRGTGPGGRVVRVDIEAAAPAGRRGGVDPAGGAAVDGISHQAEPGEGDPGEAEPGPDALGQVVTGRRTDGARRAEVARLTEAAGIPVFSLRTEVMMSGWVTLREQLREVAGNRPAATITDLVVAAVAAALCRFPELNAGYVNGGVRRFDRVDVGVAVDTGAGLLVPVLSDADRTTLAGIGSAVRELAARARSGQITPAELDGGTVTVSNLGSYGVTEFTAVLHPGQAAIVAVGAVRELPRVVAGAVLAVPVMTVTLSCDHRVVDGAPAARFLAELTALLEHPIALLTERGARDEP